MKRGMVIGVVLIGVFLAGCFLAYGAVSSNGMCPGSGTLQHKVWKGTVAEVLHGGGYAYIRVKERSKESVWVALTSAKVKVGDEVELSGKDVMVMRNFHSSSVNRDFKTVLFASRMRVNGAWIPSKEGNPHHSMGSFHGGSPHGGLDGQIAFPLPNSIPKPKGGLTIAEVYQQADELNGKEVAVRGKVLKYLSNIMGKNWLHVADGSGKDGRAEITVTTQEQVEPGDTVFITGKLSADKNLGYGYFYKAIIEDARVKVEKRAH
jgi:hypothetical protein